MYVVVGKVIIDRVVMAFPLMKDAVCCGLLHNQITQCDLHEATRSFEAASSPAKAGYHCFAVQYTDGSLMLNWYRMV